MILPTVTVAFYLTWKSRNVRGELFHNIAVCFWILANSAWMLGEFVEHEARPYAVVLFLCGLGVLLFYYIFYFRKDNRKNVTLEQLGYQLQPDDGGYEREDEKYTPELRCFVKEQDAYDSSTHSTDARPYCIGGTYGYGLDGFVEQYKASRDADEKSDAPIHVLKVVGEFEASCKTNFK